ncbi:hypothetical protein OG594_39985 [Streptomyces sp. NBC_01214]|uniref:hypothetical protein n=1 Tax=Streptomyces sp. NBC_01214 TaxID=2903777 RepID=UPI00225B49ED|nr:hypothetical protein [Streptomyces sp. NBC_01214]MCX4807709.1 hypothetical protein [Streptomyces sp. NBC_01214]
MQYDDEPVFKRSKWGTNRYYYNPDNPVGLALIVITLLFVGTMMILMANRAGPFKPAPDPAPWSPPPYEYSRPSPSSSPPGR